MESPAPASGAAAAGEDDLVARARARDAGAFRELVEQHRDRAYGLALRILRSAEDAEEVAQDAFLRAWLALPRFRGEARFSTWLHRIVARRALDRLETLRARRGREGLLEEGTLPAVDGPDPAARATAARVERLMDRLSPIQRAAVTLYYFEDHSVERVAEILEMPENTVKTHLSRARATLREAWVNDAAGSPDALRRG
jgi:RNA polymerase sigma-70 factor (ECF subfamily)